MFILRKQPRCIIRAQDLLLRYLNDLSFTFLPNEKSDGDEHTFFSALLNHGLFINDTAK